MSGFTVDTLFTAIKGLKQERACLEQKLTEQRKRRENLERTLDAMTTKNGQVQDSKAKFRETLTVAQHKVAQTQVQAEKLQQLVDEKQKRLNDLNIEMENQRKQEHEEAEEISQELSNVTDRLLELRNGNRPDHVMNLIGTYDTTITESVSEMEKTEYEIQQLSEILDELNLKKDDHDAMAEAQGIPLWQQRMVLDMFQDKIATLAHSIDMFQAKWNETQQEVTNLQNEKNSLAEELKNLCAVI